MGGRPIRNETVDATLPFVVDSARKNQVWRFVPLWSGSPTRRPATSAGRRPPTIAGAPALNSLDGPCLPFVTILSRGFDGRGGRQQRVIARRQAGAELVAMSMWRPKRITAAPARAAAPSMSHASA